MYMYFASQSLLFLYTHSNKKCSCGCIMYMCYKYLTEAFVVYQSLPGIVESQIQDWVQERNKSPKHLLV